MTAGRDAIGNVAGRWRRRGCPPAPARCCSARTSTPCATPAATTASLGVLVALAVVEGVRGAAAALPFAIEVLGVRRRGGRALRHRLPRQPRRRGHVRPLGARPPRRRRHRHGRRDRAPSAATRPRSTPPAATRRTCSATSRSTSSRARCSRPRTCPSASSPRSPGQTRCRGRLHGRRRATPGPCRWRCAATRWRRAAEWIVRRRGARAREPTASSPPSARSTVAPGASNVIPGRVDAEPRRPPPRRRGPRGRGRASCAPRAEEIAAARGLARGLDRGAGDARRRVLAGPDRARSRRSRTTRACASRGCRAAPATTPRSWRGSADVAMLFVRCAGGVSHNPAESVDGRGRRGRDRRRPSPRRHPGPRAMSALDLAIRGGTVVAAGWRATRGRRRRGRPHRRGRPTSSTDAARARLDATGLHVLPGARRRPRPLQRARPHRTGRASRPAPRALAAGGYDGVLRHAAQRAAADDRRARRSTASAPRPSAPPSSTSRSGAASCPATSSHLDELAERGVIGFKAFMSDSGIDEFATADDLTLYEGMARARDARAARRRPRRERARSPRALAARARREGRAASATTCARGRSIAELEAIGRAIAVRGGDRLRAARRPRLDRPRRRARRRGPRPRRRRRRCETCPHYLVFDEDDAERLGAVAKCAPPLRPAAERDALWAAIAAASLPRRVRPLAVAAASSSRATTSSRSGAGSPAARRCSALLLDAGHHERGLALEQVARLSAGGAARRFRLPGKGRIEPGADADLALVDLGGRDRAQRRRRCCYRHPHSPWAGRTLRARIARTLVRGTTVFADGRVTGSPAGRLVIPEPTEES